ncbi:MAG: hypothetical protein ACYC3X_03775 [Pirellulaceae bacterium]
MLPALWMPVLAGWLLAQLNPLSDLSKRFQAGGSQFPIGQIVTLLVLLLLIVAGLWKVAHVSAQREGRSHFSPRRLFKELCALHALDWPSRKLLHQLARANHLDHPARLFVEPRWFEAAQIPETLASFRPQFTQLKSRLFSKAP